MNWVKERETRQQVSEKKLAENLEKLKEMFGTIKLECLWLPRPASNYPGCYPLGFEKFIKKWLGTSNYVHFFAGLSKTGYRIDINPDVKPDLVANVENLKEIKDEFFEGAMADPPYNEHFAKDLYNCKYPVWSKWTREIVRIVKVNGLIAIMHNYPLPCPVNCEYVKIFVVLMRIKQFPRVITVFRRVK